MGRGGWFMKTWPCRFTVPYTKGVFYVPAESAEDAAQDLLLKHTDLGIKVHPLSHAGVDDSKWGPGDYVYFAVISVDGQKLIARCFTSGIVRRGGLRRRSTKSLVEVLTEVAERLDYAEDPASLLEEWEGEGTEWVRGEDIQVRWEGDDVAAD